jgi:hypothetical protein
MFNRRPSFWSVMQNAWPQIARDDKGDIDMKPSQMDAVVQYQLMTDHPRYLNKTALMLSGVCDTEKMGAKVMEKLVKHGFALPAPKAGDSSSSSEDTLSPITVNTSIIDKQFTNKIAVISIHACRKLVGLLFFWEEECNRWRLLDEEEKGIKAAIAALGDAGSNDLRIVLEAAQLKKQLLPSQRDEGVEHVFPAQAPLLPRYS